MVNRPRNSLKREDLVEFVKVFNPSNRHKRRATWTEKNTDGRWRVFDYEEIAKRDKLNLDIFWLKDKTHEESENLPEPELLAQKIVEDLEAALEQFSQVAAGSQSICPASRHELNPLERLR